MLCLLLASSSSPELCLSLNIDVNQLSFKCFRKMLCFNPFLTNDITKMEIRNQKQHCSLKFTLNIFCERR